MATSSPSGSDSPGVSLAGHSAVSPPRFTHVGWTLGNYCPYTCKHCYSEWVRDSNSGLSRVQIDEICNDLADLGVRHVTLGGNEPFFTNGPHAKDSQMPYIVRKLHDFGVAAHLVSSGPSVSLLEKTDSEAFGMLASISLSFDSPFDDEHNKNRGAPLYAKLLQAAQIASTYGVRRVLLYCAMDWNFDQRRISALLELASQLNAHPRINPAKPIVKNGRVTSLLGVQAYWEGFDQVTRNWPTQVVSEPPLRRALGLEDTGPACGSRTFRILSTDSSNVVRVTSCTYVHSVRIERPGNLGVADLARGLIGPSSGCDCLARIDGPGWSPNASSHLTDIPDWRGRMMQGSDFDGAFEDYLCTWVGGRP